MIKSTDFIGHLGIHINYESNIPVDVSLDVKEIHLDDLGHVSNGVYYTLLDIAIGSSVPTLPRDSSVTIDLHVEVFKRRNAEKLICKAYGVHKEGKIGWGQGDIIDEEGTLVARGMGTFKIMEGGRTNG